MIASLLIVNADDCGMSRGITDGIILAHRYGLVTSTSLVANMPASEYAVSRLAAVPRLGVGIHLNISAGRPILPAEKIPTLVDANGNFHRAAVMIRKLWRWNVACDEVEAEFRAQVRWMKDRGFGPTHADSHQHLHIYPAAIGPFVRALAAEGIRCTRALRSCAWPPGRVCRADWLGGPHAGSLVRRVFVRLYRRFLQAVALRRFDMPESRVSFFARDKRDLASLGASWKTTLANLPPGIFELACHPGLFERGFSEADPLRFLREEELHWLTSPDWRDAVEGRGVRLISYREVPGRRQTNERVGGAKHATPEVQGLR